MTQQEIYRQIIILPVQVQKDLIKKIKKNLKQAEGKNGSKEIEEKELSVEERLEIVESLAGSLKMENPPMTKEEVREIYYEHLMEKHK